MAKEQSVVLPQGNTGEKELVVRRGRVDCVDLYEVKENELEILEKGSPVEVYLNFAIFSLSIAFSSIATLITSATFAYAKAEMVFVAISVFGLLVGSVLMILWWQSKTSISKIIQNIRNRIPPDKMIPITTPENPTKEGESAKEKPPEEPKQA